MISQKKFIFLKCRLQSFFAGFFGKRNVFFELEGFRNLSYSDDSDFFERAEKKFKISKVDWPDYIYYRDTPDSICSTIE